MDNSVDIMAKFLAHTVSEFIHSEMFKGAPAFPTMPGQRWYTWLYLAKLTDSRNIKVGITNNLNRRDYEQQGKQIYWAWSMPTSQLVEKDIKQILHEFIKPRKVDENNDPGYTEIIHNIPIQPLILLIRLIILYVYIKYKFIDQIDGNYIERLAPLGDDRNGQRINPNVIRYNGKEYKGYGTSEFGALYDIYKQYGGPKDLRSVDRAEIDKYLKIYSRRADKSLRKIKNDISKRIAQNERDMKRVCDLDDIYRRLGIDIGLKLASTEEKEDFEEDEEENSGSQNEAPVEMVNDNTPTVSRRTKLKKGSHVYIAYKITQDSFVFYRYYLAVVLRAYVSKTKQYTRILYDLISELDFRVIHQKKRGRKREAILMWNKERIDFRDRLNNAEGTWGCPIDTDPHPGMNQLGDAAYDFED